MASAGTIRPSASRCRCRCPSSPRAMRNIPLSTGRTTSHGSANPPRRLRGMSTLATDADLMALATRLYPICRSITGAGLRQTLAILRESIPLQVVETPSGTPVFDWEVPLEWNVRAARLLDPDGRAVVDFADHNLHIVNY